MSKIYGFYHICCLNHWKIIFDDQILKINNIPNVNKIYISVICNNNNDDLNYIKENISSKFEIINISNNFSEYEFRILMFMQELSKIENFYCFYLHTKGVSITDKNREFYNNTQDLHFLLKCVNSWREYMEYFLVENTEDIFNILGHYDAVGVALTLAPTQHFSGNFWWSKSEYIKELFSLSINLERHQAEFWIGNNNKGNLYSLCNILGSYSRIIHFKEYIK